MRQNDGSEILGPNDPRGIVIGIIHVAPGDDRQSVLTAITTQEKLGRDQIILELPAQNKAFKTALDFEGLHQVSNEIEASLVLIVPHRSKIANYASRQDFTFYHSLKELVAAEFPPMQPDGTESEKTPQFVSGGQIEEVDDHTQPFPVTSPASSTTLMGTLPETPLPVAVSAEEVLTVQQMAEMPEPPSISFPAEIPAGDGPRIAVGEEDETPTDPSLSVVVAPVEHTPQMAAEEEDEVPTDPSLAAVTGMSIATLALASEVEQTASEISLPAQLPLVQPDAQDQSPLQGNYLPVLSPSAGGSLMPSNALPPVFYDPTSQPRRRSWRGFIITCAVLVVLLLVGGLFNRPILDLIFPPVATVTITPDSQQLKYTYQLTAVLGVPDPSNYQVDARALYAVSQTQSQTVKASGQGTTPGQQAHGVLTFYNISTSPQTVPAGTVIFDNHGLAVVNNDTITLPGFDPSQGSAGVDDEAHSVNVGASQNVPANDFRNAPCCGGGIYVTNQASFTGGRDGQLFTYVQQSDIDSVTQSLEATLASEARTSLQSQVHANEKPAGTPRCAPLVNSNHQAGDRVSTVTVSVISTCMGEVYDMQAVQVLAARKLTQNAGQNPGPAYIPVGQVLTNVTRSVPDDHGNVLLMVDTVGVWAYQFTSAQFKHIASLIAGKSSQDARITLLSQPGVHNVIITLTGVGSASIPDDASRITINASAVEGLHG